MVSSIKGWLGSCELDLGTVNGAKGILRRAGGPSCTFNGADPITAFGWSCSLQRYSNFLSHHSSHQLQPTQQYFSLTPL